MHLFLTFSAALGNMSKLYCTRLHEHSAVLGITRTSSVLHSLARKFVRFVGKKNIFVSKIIRGKKFRPYSVNARHTRS